MNIDMNRLLLFLLAAFAYSGDAWEVQGELKWWMDGVIYQVYPRSFKDTDNDGVGDLKGITSKLEYLRDIGVSAIWLSPIYPSPQVDAGYDISNFTDVNPEYGTLADLDALQKRAKELGIKVILDLVPNHSSDKHPWFIASEQKNGVYTDYYVWKDAKYDGQTRKPPNNWISDFGYSAWQWSEKRQQYYLHQFAIGQPDLNYRSPAVVEEMKNVMRFWLKRGIDGFRVDTIVSLFEDAQFRDEPVSGLTNDVNDKKYHTHIYTQNQKETYDMVTQWRKVLEEFDTDRVMMVEAYAPFDLTMDYYGTKEKPGAHFPFNFLAVANLTRSDPAQKWKSLIDLWMSGMNDYRWPNWVVGNHDNPRVTTRFGPELADGINMIALTLPGTGITYNGEEIAMEDTFVTWNRTNDPGALNKGPNRYTEVTRDPCRSPFQWDSSTSAGFSKNATTWLPVNPNYWQLNVAEQNSVKCSHLKIYKELTELRKEETIKRGNYKVDVYGNVLVITRSLDKKPTYITAVNFGDEETQLTLDGLPPLFVRTISMNANNIKKGAQCSWPLPLRPKAAVVLSTSGSAIVTAGVATVMSVFVALLSKYISR